MSDKKHAEVEEIVAVSRSVRGVADLTADAAAYSAEADPDPYMWGVVGIPFGQAYDLATLDIKMAFIRFPGAFAGLAERIEECAKDIDADDEESARSFDELNEPAEA